LTSLTDGVAALFDGTHGQAVLNDLVYRFDCNSYGALILDGLNRDIEPIGPATLVNNAALGIPSFINQGKLSTSLADRNEEIYINLRFGLDIYEDWLPGVLGTLVAYWGPVGLLILAMLLGVMYAAAERFIRKTSTPWRLVVALGLAQCALLYEVGPQVYFVQFRGAVTITVAVVLLRWVKPILPRIRRARVTTSEPRSAPVPPPETQPRLSLADRSAP
jgi:hypothetical protein